MSVRFGRQLGLTALVLGALTTGLWAQEGGAPPTSKPAVTGAPQDADAKKEKGDKDEAPQGIGRIRGRVVWKGEPFAPRPVLWPAGLLDRDGALATIAKKRSILDRRLLVDEKSKGLSACVVSLPALRIPASTPRKMELLLRDLAFATRAVVLPEGWSLVVRSEDPIRHRLELRRGGEVTRTFDVAPGASVEVGPVVGGEHRLTSERLPFLSARVIPRARTPRIVTDAQGAFDIRGAPAGKHQLVIDHEILGRVRKEVEVNPGETLELMVSQSDFRRGGAGSFRLFNDPGPTALEVDGLPVPEAAVARYAAFFGRRHRGIDVPERLRREQALQRVVIPLAAVWTRRADERAQLRGRLDEIRAVLQTGQSFLDVARKYSAGPPERRGSAREVLPRELEAALGEAVFGTPPGRIRGPFATSRGLHFVHVEEVLPASDPAEERRKFRQIIIPWDLEADRARLDGWAAEAAARARVRLVDPRLTGLVPPDLLR